MSYGKKDMGGIMLIFLMIVIGLALTPTIQEQVLFATSGTYNATSGVGAGNLTGGARAIYLLVPLFWVILVLAVGLAGVSIWLKQGR